MTIEEARACAKIFAEEGRGIVPDAIVDFVTNLLQQACEYFEKAIIGIDSPERLFDFFRLIILIGFVRNVDVFVINIGTMRQEYNAGDLSVDDNELFCRLMEGIDLGS